MKNIFILFFFIIFFQSNFALSESKWITKKNNNLVNNNPVNNKLESLKELLEDDLITFEEYTYKRNKILGLTNKIINELTSNILGYYKGELTYPNGDTLPVFAEIFLNNSNVEGKYSFKDFGGENLLGKLQSFEIISKNKVQFNWIDNYGRGWLKIDLFPNRFDGNFGVKKNTRFEKIGNWSGNKVSFAKYSRDIDDILGIKINNKKIKQTVTIKKDNTGPKITSKDVFEANNDLLVTIKGSVSDENEIVQLIIDNDEVSFENGKFSHKLFVKPNGQNVLIIAMDKFGNKSTKNIQLKRQTKKIIKKIFDSLDPTIVKSKINSSSVALIIGIEDYENTFVAPFAKNDALAFNDFVNTSLGVPKQNIKLLMNDQAERTKTLKILKQWLPKIVKENKTDIYVFFSGHGLASEDGEDLYLLPSDGDPDLLEDSTILRNQIFDQIAKLNPLSVTVFLDTCYSGATRTDEFLVASKPIFIEAVEQVIPSNFNVFSASSGRETAKVLKEAEHGLFSYYMMKGLQGEADTNSDNQITNGELIAFIKKNVSRQANQTPQLSGDPNIVLAQW